jgi:hypothetical protein
MRNSLSLSLTVVTMVFFGSSAGWAENPSQDKCTCDLEKGDPPDNGAWVQNATSCWSTVTARLLPRRFGFDASDEQLVVNKAVEEVVPFLG